MQRDVSSTERPPSPSLSTARATRRQASFSEALSLKLLLPRSFSWISTNSEALSVTSKPPAAAGHLASIAQAERLRIFQEGDDEAVWEESHFGFRMNEETQAMVTEEYDRNLANQVWFRFDSFFAVCIILNGLTVGFMLEGQIVQGSAMDDAIEFIFVAIFTLEFFLRWYFSGSLRQLLTEKWAVFDAFILIAAYLELINMVSVGGGSNLIALVRVVRFAKLLRMLRLMKLIQKFRLLIRGLVQAAPVFGWCMLLSLILSYLTAILIFELTEGSLDEHPDVKYYWDTVPSCMLSMMQIATLDGGSLVRALISTKQKEWWSLVFVLFGCCVFSVGIASVMVGVLLNIISVIMRRDEDLQDVEKRLKVHAEIRILRWALIAHHGLCNGSDRKFLSEEVVFNLATDCTPIKEPNGDNYQPERMHPDRWIGKSFKTLFTEASVDLEDVQLIFNTIPCAGSRYDPLSVDEFIQHCLTLKTDVHPLEVLSMRTHLQGASQTLDNCLSQLHVVLHAMDDTLHQVEPILAKFHLKRPKHNRDLTRRLAEPQEKSVGKKALRTEEASVVKQARLASMENKVWLQFDIVAASFIMANGLQAGFEFRHSRKLENNVDVHFWHMVEILYNFIFTLELVLRVALLYQMHELRMYNTSCYIFPKIRLFGSLRRLAAYAPKAFREQRYLFIDLLFVVIGLAEIIVLPLTKFAADSKPVQVFRLMRFMRFARLPHMLWELRLVAQSFWQSIPLIGAACGCLVTIVYGCAVVMCEVVGGSAVAEQNPEKYKDWNDLGHVFLILMEVATYSNFHRILEIVSDFPVTGVLIGIMLGICAVGLLNVITGMMIVSGLRSIKEASTLRLNLRFLETKARLVDVIGKALATSRDQRTQREFSMNSSITSLIRSMSSAELSPFMARARAFSLDFGRRPSVSSNTASDWTPSAASLPSSASDIPERSIIGVCCKDKDTRCRVINVMWISMREVVLDYDLVGLVDPEDEKPMLVWRGGASVPSTAMKLCDCMRLIWSDLPPVATFTFSFGPAFKPLRITPDSCRPQDLVRYGLVDLKLGAGTDTSIDSKAVHFLLKDPQLINMMHRVGLMPHQVLAVFQRLLLDDNETVSVDDFVEAMYRMNLPTQGIDMAAMKTLLRQAVHLTKVTLGECTQSTKLASNLVSKLRCIDIVNAEVQQVNGGSSGMVSTQRFGLGGAIDAQQQEEHQAVSEMCAKIRRENAKLRSSVRIMRHHVKVRSRALRRYGVPIVCDDDSGSSDSDTMTDGLSVAAERSPLRDLEVCSEPDDDDSISEYSLESLGPGWD